MPRSSRSPCPRSQGRVAPRPYTTDEDKPLAVSAANGILANDTDANNDKLTVKPISNSSHGKSTLNPDGSFSYEPDAGFNGTDTFSYKVSDGTLDSNIAKVTITVEKGKKKHHHGGGGGHHNHYHHQHKGGNG